MGQLNPGLNAWLGEVMETRSVFWLTAHYPAAGLSFLAFVVAGAAAQIALFRRRPDAEAGYRTAIVLLAVLLGCWQIQAHVLRELAGHSRACHLVRKPAR